jgi:hypothetical protein
MNNFLSPVLAMFRHDCSLVVKPARTAWWLLPKQSWRYSLPIEVFLSVFSVLVVPLPNSEIPEGLMNYPVFITYVSMFSVNVVLIGIILVFLDKQNRRYYFYINLCVSNMTHFNDNTGYHCLVMSFGDMASSSQINVNRTSACFAHS